MAWYSASFRRRVAVTIDNSTASGATCDAQGTIPKSLVDFWSLIDSAGNECRVTDAAGNLLAYDIEKVGGGAFDRTNKDGRISIDAMTVPTATNSMVLVWLYYDSTSVQGDASVAVTITSARGLYIEHGQPRTDVLSYRHPAAYATRMPQAAHKYTSEQRNVCVDFMRAMRRRQGSSQQFEEPWYAAMDVLNSSGASVAAMFTLSDLRFLTSERDRDHVYVMAPIKAGTTASPVTQVVKLWTIMPSGTAFSQLLEQRIGFKVNDTYNAT